MNWPSYITIVEGSGGYGISPVNNSRAGYVLYQCPGCGTTERQPLVSTYQINTTCKCSFPTCVYMMNVVGSWKHPNWIEFDERSYWEDKGMITDRPYIPYPVKTEEELWMERVGKNLPQAQSSGYALNVNPTFKERFQFWISLIKSLWKDFWGHPAPL